MYTHIMYMCIYIERERDTRAVSALSGGGLHARAGTANLLTKTLDFRGFDSSVMLMSRGGIPRSIGKFPEVSSQRNLGRVNLSISRETGRIRTGYY